MYIRMCVCVCVCVYVCVCVCVCVLRVCVYSVADVGGRIGVDLGFAHEDCHVANIIASMQIHRSAIYAWMLEHNVHRAAHLYTYIVFELGENLVQKLKLCFHIQ